MTGPIGLSRQRLDAVLAEIDRLGAAEFPYLAARDALGSVRAHFVADQQMLDALDPAESDSQVVDLACETILTHLQEYLPLLGLIRRSTNIRNAFELHAPLTRLAQTIVSPSVRLILSSEWEYSPFVFMEASCLLEYIFVGIPAHESGNPFILPLAGHELGHAVWHQDANSLWRISFERKIEDHITAQLEAQLPKFNELYPDQESVTPEQLRNDWEVKQTWAPAFDWAKKQSEEYFCDFVGIRIFGQSYLRAFSYLLAPRSRGERPVFYPNFIRRVERQIMAAEQYGVTVPPQYREEFRDADEPNAVEAHKCFLLGLADFAADAVAAALAEHVDQLLGTCANIVQWKMPTRQGGARANPELAKRLAAAQKDLEQAAPAGHSGGLSILLNAAWNVLLGQSKIGHIPDCQREAALRELLLKSIEVYEYEVRLETSQA